LEKLEKLKIYVFDVWDDDDENVNVSENEKIFWIELKNCRKNEL